MVAASATTIERIIEPLKKDTMNDDATPTSPSRANLRTDVSPDSENMERAGHKPESDTVRAWSKFKTGMSEAKGEQESTETLSFRCDCERCRFMRGRIVASLLRVT